MVLWKFVWREKLHLFRQYRIERFCSELTYVHVTFFTFICALFWPKFKCPEIIFAMLKRAFLCYEESLHNSLEISQATVATKPFNVLQLRNTIRLSHYYASAYFRQMYFTI